MKLPSRICKLAAAALGACALLGAPAQASQTNIAQVPLLNITGTGTVKPNLMLLFDNSGSMDNPYLPDSAGSGALQCRGKVALRDATTANPNMVCSAGQPPFMSTDYNRIYYNPAIRYQAPIKFDGSSYADMVSPWTAVPIDGFGSKAVDLEETSGLAKTATTNLITGFPDIKWCDSSSNTNNCRRNTATYTYPDAVFMYPTVVYGKPYYYNIGVAQYCSDANLTDCVSTTVGAAAPDGYPYPVKVRWCDTVNLNNCQAKQVAAFKYPSFSKPLGSRVAYGFITIAASATATALKITSVTVAEPVTKSTITAISGTTTISAPTGTDTALKQQTVASLVASAIMTRTGTPTLYWACVNQPLGTNNVSPCSAYGIDGLANNQVAIIPLDCTNTSSKATSNCSPALDAANAGWGIEMLTEIGTVSNAVAYVPPTALISVVGTLGNSSSNKLASVSWNSQTLASNIALASKATASAVVTSIVSAVNARTGITGIAAYAGGNTVTPVCAGKASTFVCLVKNGASTNLDTPSTGTLTGSGMSFTPTPGAGYTAAAAKVEDRIPQQLGSITGGSMPASTFARVDIVSTNNSYPRGANRSDCAGSISCTYAEEMTNFANWYAYYKTRIQMTKTAVGLAFAPVSDNYRVGFVKMSNAGASKAIDIKPAPFDSTARQAWYKAFYDTVTSGSTPTRAALDSVGKMFANIYPYDYASGEEVVRFPCQQNFVLLTTDGYWNLGFNTGATGSADSTESAARFCTAARGCVDKRVQTNPSLADVALYWYNGGSNTGTVSLRPAIDDVTKPGLVPGAAGENTHLHVNTFTLGLGIDGVMNYEDNYDTAPKVGGDFYNLLTGATTGCPWNGGGAYVWPDPQSGTAANSTASVQERVDDLWHAAVNGHGKYFSANEPSAVQSGLSQAIAAISVRVGAAAAAATSTPNISQQDNDIFSAIFVTGRWYGEMSDKKIDIITGKVGTTALWNTSDRVGLKVDASTDTRTIKMLDTATNTLKDFSFGTLTDTEKAWFANKCSVLPQCALLSAADKAKLNSSENVVNWLRGQQQHADDQVMRAYTKTTPTGTGTPVPIVLGDIASSKPAFVRTPMKSYPLAGYSDFKIAKASRAATVYTAANDGMLHAFSAATGDELWAYAPRITMQKLYKLASINYSTNHLFTTDGSPEVSDVQIGGAWKTVLVAGLNGGGRGYYALDVTDPANPVALWELCADATICSKNDADIGLTFGNPQFGYWQGKWVVFLTSGYNNVSGVDNVAAGASGHGFLYIVDVANGTVLKKIDTTPLAAATTGTPSGLAKITSISSNPFTDPVTTYVYGGDNQGQLWRFDLTSASPGVVGVIKLGDAGVSQPITSRPEVTQCLVTDTVDGVSTQRVQRVVLFGTGRLLDVSDSTDMSNQTLYALRDTGSAIANIRSASMVRQALSTVGSSNNIATYGVTNRKVDLATQDGWYIDFDINQGERINLDPQVVAGGVNVVTNTPTSSSSCSVGGSSNVYQFAVCSGAAVTAGTPTMPGQDDTVTVAGGTLSASSAAVGFIIVRLPSGSIKMITTFADGRNDTGNVTPPASLSSRKVGWRGLNGE
ncbi:pilus assembly protein [Massilia sp. DWR3-1-1]|uniref:pilus assembly protein n=1 Tax=Massilia sp. DWR3-1-1 TaxID=2804559 RepID=UPI003CF9BA0E